MRTNLLLGKHPLWGLLGMKGCLPWRAEKPIHLHKPPKTWLLEGQALAWPLRGLLRCLQALHTIDKPKSRPPCHSLWAHIWLCVDGCTHTTSTGQGTVRRGEAELSARTQCSWDDLLDANIPPKLRRHCYRVFIMHPKTKNWPKDLTKGIWNRV